MSATDVLSGAKRWHVERGEALALLRALPDASVDAVVTDPPYSSGGMHRGDRTAATGDKYTGNDVKIERPDFAGDTRDQRAFGYWCALWISECLRICKPGAPICIFTDWRQLPTTTDAIQAGGFIWRGIVPWDKGEGTRPTLGRFRAQAEYVVWGSAGPMPIERDAPVLPGVIPCPVLQADKHHQTGKPVEAMRKVNAICERGGLILDPFCGSGSTGVAGIRDGFRFLGFEQTEAYAMIAVERLRAEEMGLSLADARRGQVALFGGAS